jgi:diguanylate cyclase (GGDEF)-like protein
LHQRHYHDELTDLPNRNAVEDLHNRRPVHSLGVIDIDGFRFINESYGYARGDIVLKTMADRLRSIDEMRVARSGADEFLLLYEGDISKDYALHRRIRELCHTPVETDEGPIEISCSSGIAVRNENQSLHELMAEADLALYQAKQAG